MRRTTRSLRTWMSAGALTLAMAGAAMAQGDPYRVVVRQVDSSNFPEVTVEFQVFTQDVNAPTWSVDDFDVEVLEQVMGMDPEAIPGLEVSEVEPCSDPKDVALAIALDVSGSVTEHLPEMQQGIVAAFEHMKTYTDTEDVGGVFAFSSDGTWRFPQTPGEYVDEPSEVQQAVQQIPNGGASPIWAGMREELTGLLGYRRGEEDGPQRVLATFTDGMDNSSSGGDGGDLLQKAARGGAVLVMLGYGQIQNFAALQTLANASGGVYVPGATDNVEKALTDIIEAVRRTYCVTYKSPHQNVVNEPADVTVSTGGSMGSARFPLPFLIPEDQRDTELFMPVTQFQYQTLAAGPTMPFVEVEMTLRDADGQPLQAEGPERPEASASFMLPPSAWGCGLDGMCGYSIRRTDFPDKWDDLFQVPTERVELHDRPDETVIDGIVHYDVRTRFMLEGFDAGAAREYPSATRLSVQDRTPPHVLLQVRPQDGGAVLRARVHEQEIDQDPNMFGGDRPSYAAVKGPGQGAKRARIEYQWRSEDGEVQGQGENEAWALWQDGDGDGVLDTPVFRAGDVVASVGGQDAVLARGIEVAAGTRLALEIAARDNYTGLVSSTRSEDADAFSNPGFDPVEGAAHARFDLNASEAQPGRTQDPYLARVPREDLEADLSTPGLAWWIEDRTQGVVPDRFAGLDGITEVIYTASDEDVRDQLAEEGEFLPPGPLRVLKIRAQDGNGNVTLLETPLVILETGFQARTLQWRSRREAFLD